MVNLEKSGTLAKGGQNQTLGESGCFSVTEKCKDVNPKGVNVGTLNDSSGVFVLKKEEQVENQTGVGKSVDEHKDNLGQKIEVSGNVSVCVEVFCPQDETNPRETQLEKDSLGGESKIEGNSVEKATTEGVNQLAVDPGTKGAGDSTSRDVLLDVYGVKSGSTKLSGAKGEENMDSTEREGESSGRGRKTGMREQAEKVGNGGEKSEIGIKTGKGSETRERKKSRYLSPPYVDLLNEGRKTLPASEIEAVDGKEPSIGAVEKSVTVKSSKPKKKLEYRSRRGRHNFDEIARIKASPGELLGELRLAAMDCLYPNESKGFNKAERFFTCFRNRAFNTLPYHLMLLRQSNGKPYDFKGEKEKKRKEDSPGVGLTLSQAVAIWNRKSKKDEGPSVRKNRISFPGALHIPKVTEANGRVIEPGRSAEMDVQETCLVTPEGKPLQKKRKKKAGPTSEVPPTQENAASPVLNGNSDEHVPKKSKMKERVKLADSNPNVIPTVVDSEVMNPTQLGSDDKIDQVVGASSVEVKKEPVFELGLNPEKNASQLEANGEKGKEKEKEKESEKEMINFIVPSAELEPKKRKRKEKDSALAGVNGNVGESSNAVVTDSATGKTPRRRVTKADAKIPDFSVNYERLLANADVSGTALLLKFAPEFPIPTKEALGGIFGVFGPINELDMQIVDHPSVTQVVFRSALHARDAFCSLAISNPFGRALVNYRLVHLSADDARAGSESQNNSHAVNPLVEPFYPKLAVPPGSKPNIKLLAEPSGPNPSITLAAEPSGPNPSINPAVEPSVPNPSTNRAVEPTVPKPKRKPRAPVRPPGLKPNTKSPTPTKPPGLNSAETPSGVQPSTSGTHDLLYIRKNLEMMNGILEKGGANISPDLKAKLESEIKGLMKKVSTMVGDSSSSS